MRDYISKEYSLSIDFLDYSKNKDTEVKSIIYSEKDTNTAFVIADLFANGEPINLNGYDKVVVGIKKNDGLRVQNDCTILDSINGQIEVPFTTQSLASVGVNYFDITLYKNKTELVSPKFSYRVMEAMIDDDTLESSSEFGTLTLLIEKTEELLNRTNDACDRVETLEELMIASEAVRNSNEETRKSNETSRVSAENTRKSNEITRISSENSRVSAENARVSFYNETVIKEDIRVTKENERIASENTRVSNENARKSEENTRKSNETTRVNSENSRVSAENTRKSNEITRVSSEQVRVTNETNRESQFEILSDNMVDTNTHWDTLFQNRYDNLNQEYSELVDTLDKDVLENRTSEDLLNENVTSFKVGTGTVDGVAKDYTNEMQQSLVSIDNVEGKTVREQSNTVYKLSSVDLSNIGIEKHRTSMPTNIEFYEEGTVNTTIGATWEETKEGTSPGKRYRLITPLEIPVGTKYLCVRSKSFDKQNNICFLTGDSTDLTKRTLIGSHTWVNLINNNVFMVEIPKNTTAIGLVVRSYDDNSLAQDFANTLDIEFICLESAIQNQGLTLHSLPNGIKDKLENSVISRKVGYLDTTGMSSLPGQDFSTVVSGGKTYGRLAFDLPNGDVQGQTKALCDRVEVSTYNSDWNTPTKNTLVVNLSLTNKARCGFVMEGVTTIESMILALSTNVPRRIIYQLNNPSQEHVNTSILAISEDTIFIDSPIQLNCNHKVQLNTKSQVEALQEVVQKEKKSVWQKISDIYNSLSGASYNNISTGYIKLPIFLGGLIFQWGNRSGLSTSTSDDTGVITFPIAYPVSCNIVMANCGYSNGQVHSIVTWGQSQTAFQWKRGSTNVGEFKWFSIGR